MAESDLYTKKKGFLWAPQLGSHGTATRVQNCMGRSKRGVQQNLRGGGGGGGGQPLSRGNTKSSQEGGSRPPGSSGQGLVREGLVRDDHMG